MDDNVKWYWWLSLGIPLSGYPLLILFQIYVYRWPVWIWILLASIYVALNVLCIIVFMREKNKRIRRYKNGIN
jgi:hypothetical protein